MKRSNLGQGSETNSASASSSFVLQCGLVMTTELSHLMDEHRFAIATVAVGPPSTPIRLPWAGSRTLPATARSSRI